MSTNNLLPSTSAGGFSTVGNIAGNVFIGNGSQLTGVTGNLAFYDTSMYVPANVSSQFINISYNGEGYSYFQLPSDATANSTNALLNNQIGNVTIGTGRAGFGVQSWMFGNDGILTVPGEGIIQSNNDTVILQSKDTGTGNVYSARLGTNGGLYFATTEYPAGWLDITNNAGNANITSPMSSGGTAGHNLNLAAGATDTGSLTSLPGGDLNLVGGQGGYADDGYGGPGGDVNITAGAPGESAGEPGNVNITAGNVNITAGEVPWAFNNVGQLTVANLAISATNGIGSQATIFEDNGSLAVLASGTNGVVNVGWAENALTLGNTSVMWFNEPGNVGNAVIRTGNTAADSYAWIFDNTGNLAIPNSILAQGVASPAPVISGFRFTGEISTTGNVFAGVVSASGNVRGGNINTAGEVTANSISITGNITGNTAGYAIGYRDIPQIIFSGNTTIDTTNAGKHFYSTQSTNYTLTIANNASQGFQVGTAITLVNQGTGTITVAQGSGVTLYIAGNTISGNRTVATFGMATLMKVATDTWFINGTGVS